MPSMGFPLTQKPCYCSYWEQFWVAD